MTKGLQYHLQSRSFNGERNAIDWEMYIDFDDNFDYEIQMCLLSRVKDIQVNFEMTIEETEQYISYLEYIVSKAKSNLLKNSIKESE